MRRAHRVDVNHTEIVRAFEKLGARVLDLSRVGRGVPDLLVRFRNRMRFVEVKSEKGKLNKAQEEFATEWPVSVVRTVDDVAAIVHADRLSDYPSNGKDNLPGWK